MSFQYRPFASYSIYPSPRGSLMAAIKVYSDDSGDADDPQHSVISVAANLCDDRGWPKFEADWAAILKRFDVPYLHMREWVNRDSPIYRHLRDAEPQALFFESLVSVIKDDIRYSAGASINLPDLRRFNEETGLNLEPYALALYVAIVELRKIEPSAEIQLIVDKLNDAHRKIELAKCYAHSDVFDLKVASIEISPLKKEESFRTILPMQAGDFFAWEMRKSCEERKTWTPSDNALMNYDIFRREHGAWESDFFLTNNRMPRLRTSAFKLMTSIKQGGPYLDYRGIQALHKSRHPNGWGN